MYPPGRSWGPCKRPFMHYMMALLLVVCVALWAVPRNKPVPDEERLDDGRVILSKDRYRQLVVQAALCADNATFFTNAYRSLQEAHTAEVRVTAYNATVEQCGKSDGRTASGTSARADHTLAVSRDLWHLRGRHVRVLTTDQDLGVFHVEDRMAHGKVRSVDIFMVKPAVHFGSTSAKLVPL